MSAAGPGAAGPSHGAVVDATPPLRSGARGEGRVLHLVPPDGGGVDRCVRDLCRGRRHDWIVHVCDDQCVVEWPAGDVDATFLPLAMDDAVDLLFDGAWGVPVAVHAHSTTAAVRRLCRTLCAATGAPAVVTLHDVAFDDGSVPALERGRRQAFARWAGARTAPGDAIVARAAAAAIDGCRRIDNGCDALTPAPLPAGLADPAGIFDVAVIGAIGEHKGLQRLLEVAAALPPAVRIVVLGYTGQQLIPGWTVPGRLWMHGAFERGELPALVARYGARLAWFPPGVPESYSYALSDAWQAGLPALVPDHGALAERVQRAAAEGAGWTYARESGAVELAARVVRALGAAVAADGGGATRAAAALTTVEGMTRAMTALYAETGQGAATLRPADPVRLHALARTHLDARFFRRELRDLTAQLAAAQAAAADLAAVVTRKDTELAAAHAALAELDARRAGWAADREALAAERQALGAALQALQQRQAVLQADHGSLQAAHGVLQGSHDALQRHRASLERRHQALTARLAAPLRVLPATWRARLVEAGRRWLDR